MGSLAEMALEHARLRLKGKVKQPKPRASQVAAPGKPAQLKSLEVVITGPINHLMFLEGRNWAVDMVASLRAAPADVVIERLTGATSGRPGSYAAGIQSVINELRGTGSA
ncbi:hypothetical protein I5P84_05935 [Pseudomonas mosselii]|jgi:hypothetical protein|uniref:hypothetical protein n=1 Tax=Pseudomonas mosselii TaxID=78327 RepID=UPI0018D9E3A3|nr:hypothetical protein [Pseudomonas mosselii]MBH3308993.1 hypothetical protein [Pseudomonas mosselii]MBH3324018.1 hypothetical protein [Pseudomonas mosselii]